MSETTTIACDICGKQKETANHWFKGYLVDAGDVLTVGEKTVGFMVVPLEVDRFSMPFQNHALPKPDTHLCGEQCVSLWVSRNLQREGK